MRERRLAIFGDLSGHLPPLVHALERLEVEVSTGRIPNDLVIVQVGDLVHRGPDSDAVVTLVDRFLQSGQQWVQLIGNHEAMHLGGPEFSMLGTSGDEAQSVCNCADVTVAQLRAWQAADFLRLACAVQQSADGRQALVTHAGLGVALWRELGAPRDAGHAARLVHNDLVIGSPRAFAPGAMLDGATSFSLMPSVVWADPVTEVYVPWVQWMHASGDAMPFSQIHGHASIYHWRTKRWLGMPQSLAHHAVADPVAHHTRVMLGDARFVGVDPGYSARKAPSPLRPLMVRGMLLDG